MHTIDLIVFLVFTGGIVLLGASFYKMRSSADDFTSAGRCLPGWVVGMSIFSTYVSSISYLGYPGSAYSSNWNAFVFSLSIPIASYVAARWFVPFYRRQASVSAYAFLERRFGLWARWYAAFCYLITQAVRTGTIVFLLAMPMNLLLGWDMQLVIVITSVAIIFYSMLGGVRGVIWTEALQGVIMIVGALICLGILLFTMPEGPSQTFSIAMQADKFSLGSFGLGRGESTFWVCMVYGIFTNLQNYGIDQNYVQRYHTARSDKAARFSALFGGYLFIPVSAVFFLIGTALFSYYQVFPERLADSALKGDYVFPYFIVNQLPSGFSGLLVASIFAAGMSTVATSITSASTIVLTDFYRRLRGSDISDDEQLLVLKGAGVVIGMIGIFIAIALVNVGSILDAWWKLSSIFSGGMLGLFLLGFISKKVHNAYAAIGVVCGVLTIAWISLSGQTVIHEFLSIVFGTVVIFLVGFLLARLLSSR